MCSWQNLLDDTWIKIHINWKSNILADFLLLIIDYIYCYWIESLFCFVLCIRLNAPTCICVETKFVVAYCERAHLINFSQKETCILHL